MAFAISIVSYSFGAAAFFLCLCLFLLYRAPLLKRFLVVQALFITNIGLNGVYEYFIVSLPRSSPLPVIWSLAALLWAPVFFYCTMLYVCDVSSVPFTGWKKRGTRAVSIVIGILILAPLFMHGDVADHSRQLERMVFYANIPLVLLAGLISIVVMSLRHGKTENPIIRALLSCHVILESVGLPVIIYLYVRDLAAGGFMEIRLKTAIDVFVLAWNLQIVALFVVFALRAERDRVPMGGLSRVAGQFREAGKLISDSLAKYEKSTLSRTTAEACLVKLETCMREEKPYLQPELSLVRLAEMVGIPRNLLSQVLNEYRKQRFNDYLNAFRVEEAKRLLDGSPRPVNVLRIAFDAGFNSKTTFYRAFRKATGATPTEYAALRDE